MTDLPRVPDRTVVDDDNFDAWCLVLSDLQAVSTVKGGSLVVNRAAFARAIRGTSGYTGVTCAVTLDQATGNRIDDPAALAKCAVG